MIKRALILLLFLFWPLLAQALSLKTLYYQVPQDARVYYIAGVVDLMILNTDRLDIKEYDDCLQSYVSVGGLNTDINAWMARDKDVLNTNASFVINLLASSHCSEALQEKD